MNETTLYKTQKIILENCLSVLIALEYDAPKTSDEHNRSIYFKVFEAVNQVDARMESIRKGV